MRLFLKLFLLFAAGNVFSQNLESISPSIKIDSLYREDQFYFGLTLNTLQNKPSGLNQTKFSTGISMGFLRDMPINKKRTVAFASGLGLCYNNYNQNLAITIPNQVVTYTIIASEEAFGNNRFSQLLVELPLEFRWRTSTYESHKFWRIYGGFKMSYLLYDRSVFEDSLGKTIITNNKDFNKLVYGIYISSGYNSINVYAYYGLKRLFQSAETSTEPIKMNTMTIGVMFYIL